jgi:hypothetical protein
MHQLSKHVSDDLVSLPMFEINTLGFDKLFINDAYTEGSYNVAAQRAHLYMSNFGVLNSSMSLSDLRSFSYLQSS